MTSHSHTSGTANSVTVTHHAEADREAFLDKLAQMTDTEISGSFEVERLRFRSMHRRGRTSGAVVDEALSNFRAFLAELGPIPSPEYTLDRIDNNNPSYEPGNVRWATPREQANNRSNTLQLTIDGETLPLTVWADRVNVKANTIRQRLRRGASHELAVYPERSLNESPSGGISSITSVSADQMAAKHWQELGCTPENWEPYYRIWWKRWARMNPLATRSLFASYICQNAFFARRAWDAEVDGPYPLPPDARTLDAVNRAALSRMSRPEREYLHVVLQGRHRPPSPREAADLAKAIK